MARDRRDRRVVVAANVAALVEAGGRAHPRRRRARAIAARGRFRVALAGGSTPRALYPHLVDRRRLDARRRLLRRRARRAARRSAVELPHGARDAARRPRASPTRTSSAGAPRPPTSTPPRATTSRRCAPAPRRPGSTWRCSGSGPDGHTASLFPGTAALAEEDRLGGGRSTSPRSATRRLTLTYPALLRRGARSSSWSPARDKARRAGRRAPARTARCPPRASSTGPVRWPYSATGTAAQDITIGPHDGPGRRHRRHQLAARDLRRAGRRACAA